jgi:methionine sulfoxide reductase heme-binding subunit
LIPLAITSNQPLMKELGGRWRQLHRLVYVVACLGAVHYWWMVKKDIPQPPAFGCILLIMLAMRMRGFSPPAFKGPSLHENHVRR